MLKIIIIFTWILFLAASIYAFDFKDMKSSALTSKAWEALKLKNWSKVQAYTDKCIALYSKNALKQQNELKKIPSADIAFTYWALNDVATCAYIKATMLKEQSQYENSKKICEEIINKYSYAQCYDPKGFFWSITDACRDLILTLGNNIDFEDFTSETLTRKAWESMASSQIQNTIIYAEKCISLYEKEAKIQGSSISNFAPKDKAFDYWALNDVGTCYYILGEAFENIKEYKKSIESYEKAINEFPYSQCWDPKGFFWKVSATCRGKLNKIKAELLN